jgi:hypothetical protein
MVYKVSITLFFLAPAARERKEIIEIIAGEARNNLNNFLQIKRQMKRDGAILLNTSSQKKSAEKISILDIALHSSVLSSQYTIVHIVCPHF